MYRLQILIGVLALAVLTGCGSKKQEPNPAASTAALAPQGAPSAQPSVQTAPSKAARANVPLEVSEKQTTAKVLSQIHRTDLSQMELGKLAAQKASSSEVRDYGQQLVSDYASVDQQVLAMAQKMAVDLDKGARSHKATRTENAREPKLERKLKTASGADFDKMFLEQTRADHEQLITKLQQDRDNSTDQDLEALLDKIIPILEQHRELATVLIKKEKA
jgi:putative membrane protein